MSQDKRQSPCRRGVTLVEILMSAALLGLISALFMGAVLPALQREDWFFNSQDHLRNFISAKENLSRRLRDSRVLPDSEMDPDDPGALLEYQRPVERDTDIGMMPDIDRSEAATWEPTIFQIRRRDGAGLVESVRGGDDRRLFWRMADTDEVEITQSTDRRSVIFKASGAIASQRAGGSSGRWNYVLRVRLR